MSTKWNFDNIDNYQGMSLQEDYCGEPLIEDVETPLDTFRLFFTDELLEKIAEDSNKYYHEKLKLLYGDDYKEKKYTKNSLPSLFLSKGINKYDILVFIGIRIYMGINKFPSIDIYWNQKDSKINKINELMSRNFFKMIGSSLHLPSNEIEEDKEEKKEDKNDEIINTDNINKKHYMNDSFESEDILNYSESETQKEETKEEDNENKSKSERKSSSCSSSSDNSSSSFTSSDSGSFSDSSSDNSDKKKKKKEKKNKKDKNKNNEDKKKKEKMSVNNSNYDDPRNKVNWFLKYLIRKFQASFHLGYDLTIDESMVFYKGRSKMKFYMPSKPCKYGFKLHCLVDSKTSYLYNLIMDPGRAYKKALAFKDDSAYAENIVLKLIENIKKNEPHRIFFDGWYSSISLLTKLKKRGFLALSILRNNTKDIPKNIKNNKSFAYSKDILLQRYHDKKLILFISNFKDSVDNLRNIYNVENRGVDKLNQKMSYYTTNRKEYKWWKKIFLFGINCCCINSRILYGMKKNIKLKDYEFNSMIVDEIFKLYKDYTKRNDSFVSKDIIKEDEKIKKENEIDEIYEYFNLDRNNGEKFTIYMPVKKKKKLYHLLCKEKGGNKKCAYCKDKKANYYCKECQLALHPECFSVYHNMYVL